MTGGGNAAIDVIVGALATAAGVVLLAALLRRIFAVAAGEWLGSLAVDSREASRGSELMILDAAFLVAADRLERFDRELDATAAEEAGLMRFNCVGPLPPYSFVDLRLPTN